MTGKGMVSCAQPNPVHAQMELCMIAHHFHGLVANGPQTQFLWTKNWGPLFLLHTSQRLEDFQPAVVVLFICGGREILQDATPIF